MISRSDLTDIQTLYYQALPRLSVVLLGQGICNRGVPRQYLYPKIHIANFVKRNEPVKKNEHSIRLHITETEEIQNMRTTTKMIGSLIRSINFASNRYSLWS